MFTASLLILGLTPAVLASIIPRQSSYSTSDNCPGYALSNPLDDGSKFTADLALAGPACNLYGSDLPHLKLEVEYQSESRLHVKILDPEEQAYQVAESVFPRPSGSSSPSDSLLGFKYTADPFTFAVVRKSTNETLFDSSAASLIFENQYLRLRTRLPSSPHLYGLGEHTDPFQLNTTNYTRTLWNRDAYGIPNGTNLYGDHPVYFDHRGEAGTHAVFLLNSNGKDIKIDNSDGQFLEYNTLGGILDLYFLAGPTPKEVSIQYSEIVQRPVMQPYWGFGFHQCKYGYRDVYQVAEVVANYSVANIPLETMWTDIDYMDVRKVFTLDPERFPIGLMQQLVEYLHKHQQHYVVMVDPAVSSQDNEAFDNGVSADVFLKRQNSSLFEGAVWPGPTVYPDWFHPDTQQYWDEEFANFFDANTGLDIDALWIDMNEAANFCPYPCLDPVGFSNKSGNPPPAPPVRPNAGRVIPGFPADFQPSNTSRRSVIEHSKSRPSLHTRQTKKGSNATGLSGRDLVNPKYQIHNAAGAISNLTIQTDLINYDGSAQYDTHNLYGTMMSMASRNAMLARRPGRRPLIITRSTFAGAGHHVGKWLGDNLSLWQHYRISIAEMLEFVAIYQVPMVGSDVCGFGDNTTETLCARWATLGAFYPFFRNHDGYDSIPQEFYRWPLVAEAARNLIAVRYRLLDYIYTHLHRQTVSGLPLLNPLFFQYPNDANTFNNSLQFFYGDNILVSPVTEENSTSVSIYLPKDIFYDYWTHERIEGTGSWVQLHDVPFTSIPLHIRGGSIIALREDSANTTTELRKKNFVLLIATNATGQATGSLYLDEGDAIEQPHTSEIVFGYDNGRFSIGGTFGYHTNAVIRNITVLQAKVPSNSSGGYEYSSKEGSTTVVTEVPLTGAFTTEL